MIDRDERRLIELAQGGDQEAFSYLFLLIRPQIRAVGCEIFRGPGSELDLEDFCSDVYLLGLRYLSSFREECAFSTWIVQIARHKVFAILQRRAQIKNGDNRLVYQGCDMSDEEWENECYVERDRRPETSVAKLDVACLIKVINTKYRELVELHHLEGYTESEIAEKTGLSVPAVRSGIYRAMVQLRKKVEKGASRNGTEFSLTK
jgi:RNA polymerase sigma factor (sigma-70 family)